MGAGQRRPERNTQSNKNTPKAAAQDRKRRITLSPHRQASSPRAGAFGSGRVEWRAAFAQRVLPSLRAFCPDLVLISAGFDGAAGDIGTSIFHPVGTCKMSEAELRDVVKHASVESDRWSKKHKTMSVRLKQR